MFYGNNWKIINVCKDRLEGGDSRVPNKTVSFATQLEFCLSRRSCLDPPTQFHLISPEESNDRNDR